LAIARQCYGHAAQAHLLAIRGYEFAFIEEMTEQANENLQAALLMLSERIQALQGPAP
jgi:DNA-binding ferritin-like protein